MTTTDPDPQSASEPTAEPTPQPRKRQSKAVDEANLSVDASTGEAVKPKRKRKTKAEKEAERMARAKAEAEKPIDPKIWLELGAILLVVAGFIYVDPVGFAEAGRSYSEGMWIRDVLAIFVGILGKTPTVLVLAAIALLSLFMGVWGWLDARKQKKSDEEGQVKS